MDHLFANEKRFMHSWREKVLSILRIVTAVMFLTHGSSKILSFPLSPASGPEPGSLYWVAGMMELIGGLLLIAGFLTRPVAFILSGQMAVAYWMVHAPVGTFPALNGGEAAVLYCFVFLYFVFAGAGPWSVDAWFSEKFGATEPAGTYYDSGHDEAETS